MYVNLYSRCAFTAREYQQVPQIRMLFQKITTSDEMDFSSESCSLFPGAHPSKLHHISFDCLFIPTYVCLHIHIMYVSMQERSFYPSRAFFYNLQHNNLNHAECMRWAFISQNPSSLHLCNPLCGVSCFYCTAAPVVLSLIPSEDQKI